MIDEENPQKRHLLSPPKDTENHYDGLCIFKSNAKDRNKF